MAIEYVLVDACIARSISEYNAAIFPNSHSCLHRIRKGLLKISMTPSLHAEWERHATRFMTRWLLMLEQRGHVRWEKDKQLSDLRKMVKLHVKESEKLAVLMKDIHISEAAILYRFPVLSFDNTQRRVLSELKQQYLNVGKIQWFNPETDFAELTMWFTVGYGDSKICAISDFGDN